MLLPAVIVVLIALSLAPSRFHLYGDRLSAASTGALWPVTEPVRRATNWFGTDPPLPSQGTASDMRERILQQQGLVVRLQEENRELRDRVAVLAALRNEIGRGFQLARGSVYGGSTDPSAQTVRVSVGTNDGVAPGMAVIDAKQLALVGRVVQTSAGSCAVEPVTVKGTLLEVVIAPKSFARADLAKVTHRRVLLEYVPSEGFIGKDIDAKMAIGVGDFARLSDRSGRIAWPDAVQGMVVGQVEHIEGDDDNPLRQWIRVKPIRSLRRADEVIVVVPGGGSAGEGEGKP